MTAHYQRVCKQMLQMFGPQWTEKFGVKNEAWDEALKDLTYSQVQAGLRKVMQQTLKLYQIDLPMFLELCKPPARPYNAGEMKRPDWMEGMSAEEVQMHCFANMKMFSWCFHHPKYGNNGPETWTKEQNERLWSAARKISHDFFLMREEMGKENVPQEDFLKALHRAWERAAHQEPK